MNFCGRKRYSKESEHEADKKGTGEVEEGKKTTNVCRLAEFVGNEMIIFKFNRCTD